MSLPKINANFLDKTLIHRKFIAINHIIYLTGHYEGIGCFLKLANLRDRRTIKKRHQVDAPACWRQTTDFATHRAIRSRFAGLGNCCIGFERTFAGDYATLSLAGVPCGEYLLYINASGIASVEKIITR